MPSGGYTKGQAAADRTDMGDGDIAPEVMGRDFFAYRPVHLASSPSRGWMARIVNDIQDILDSGDYLGAVWTQGSPRVEETLYWLNLMLDTTLPVCGNAAQRIHGEISNDGPKNLVDSVDYITSRVWQDGDGKNRAGTVVIQEQQIFASREVQKGEARPRRLCRHRRAWRAAGRGAPRACRRSSPICRDRSTPISPTVNRTRLPESVTGYTKSGGGMEAVEVAVKDADGRLLEAAIPKVTITKEGNYSPEAVDSGPDREVDLVAQIDDNLAHAPLAGFVVEGQSPYGSMTNAQRNALMMKAVHSGMPVVRVGRGNNEGFSARAGVFLGGSNLTSTKARLVLIACLLKFGALPPAADPSAPTEAETAAIQDRLDLYQAVFDTH